MSEASIQPQGFIQLNVSPLSAGIAGVFYATATGIWTNDNTTYRPTGSGIVMGVGKLGYASRGVSSNADTIRLSPANTTNTIWDAPQTQVSVMVVARKMANTGGNSPVFANNSPNTPPYTPWGLTDKGGVGQMLFGVGTVSNGIVEISEPTALFGDGLAHVYIGTYDGATMRLYRDGVQVASAPQSGTLSYFNASDRGTSIGNYFNFPGTRTFLGEIFGGALWKRSLAPAEVLALTANPWALAEDMYSEDEFELSDTGNIFSSTGSVAGLSSVTSISAAIAAAYGSSFSTSQVLSASNAIYTSTGAVLGSAGAQSVARSITQAAGVSTGVSTASVASVYILQVNANTSGTSVVTGLTNAVAAATTDADGSAVGTSTASAIARSVAQSIGVASGSVLVSSAGQTLAQAVANAVAYSTASATSVLIATSTGATVGASASAGVTARLMGAAGQSQGSSGTQGVVVVVFQASGMSLGASTIDAVSANIRSAVAVAKGSATVTGITEGGIHYTAWGDKFNITLLFSPYEVKFQSQKYTVEKVEGYKMELNR